MAHADGGDGVTVIRRLGGHAAGNRTAGTGAIFDDELLAQGFGQPVGKNARGDICSATRSEPDQNMDRL
jgi:hypothetical protein